MNRNRNTAPATRPTRRWATYVAVFVTALGATLSLSTAGASATTWAGNGYYGGVTPYIVQSSDYNQAYGPANIVARPGLLLSGPTVTRSNGSAGGQYVKLRWVHERWNGSAWVSNSITEGGTYYMAATTKTMKFPNVKVPMGTGYHRVTAALSWSDQNGRNLGTKAIAYDGARDYQCVYSHYNKCAAGQGGFIYLED